MAPRGPGPTLSLAIVVAVAVSVYATSLPNGFVLDDSTVVEQNPLVTSHAFGRILAAPYHYGPRETVPTGLYRPLTTLSFAMEHAAAGLRPLLYHADNVALNAAVSVLVLLTGLALALPPGAALAGALLFAVHPAHSEAVANVSGRAELLAAAFFLLALLAFARGREPDGRVRLLALVAAAALSLLAMLSKEHAVTFVGVAAAWEILVRRGPSESLPVFLRARRAELSRTLLVLLLPVAAYLVLRRAVLGGLLLPPASVTAIENPAAGLPPIARSLAALAAAGRYALVLVFPRVLSPDYGFAETAEVRSPLDPWLLLGLLAAAALAVGLLVAWRRSRAAAFLLLLAALPFAPVSNFPFAIGTIMAERLLYLPSVGLCLLAGAAWPALVRQLGRASALALAAVLLVGGSIRTVGANLAWHDEFSLWSRAYDAAPRSVKVLGNLAVELAMRGRLDEARQLLERAVLLAPDFAPNRINLAGVLLKLGNLDAAEAEVRHVLDREPGEPAALLQLGAIRSKRAGVRRATSPGTPGNPPAPP
ncbi:MAG: tetratricopeptide repeat protein [Acidobacteriia bacterium]|nr:tetratricopeptide repeat protein [Terriglobia bacterium]